MRPACRTASRQRERREHAHERNDFGKGRRLAGHRGGRRWRDHRDLAVLAPADVPVSDFSYPLSHGVFAVEQVLVALHHAALAVAVFLVWRAGLAGGTRFASLTAWFAAVTLAAFAVWELVAISGAGQPYPSEQTAWLDNGYGVLSMALGISGILQGIAVVRARVLTGWLRWLLLALGIYVFVPMTPVVMLGYTPARLALAGWSLLFALLGLVMLRAADASATSRTSSLAVRSGASV